MIRIFFVSGSTVLDFYTKPLSVMEPDGGGSGWNQTGNDEIGMRKMQPRNAGEVPFILAKTMLPCPRCAPEGRSWRIWC